MKFDLLDNMNIEEWVIGNINRFKITGSEAITAQNLDQTEYTSRYDLQVWAQGLTKSVGLLHGSAVPPDVTTGKRLSYSHGEVEESCYVCTFTCPMKVKAGIIHNWLYISGNYNFTTDIRNLPYPDSCVIYAPQKGSFPVLKGSALAIEGSTAVYERVVYTVMCDDYELVHFLESGKTTAEMGLMAVIYNLYPYARSWLTANTTVIGYPDAIGKLRLGQINVHKGTNKFQNDYFCVRTTLYLLGSAYTQNKKVADQLQRRGRSAARSINKEFPDKAAVSSAITACDWEITKRTGLMDDSLARILAIDKKGEFNIDVATVDLKDLQVMKDEKTVSDWGIALLEQARLVYANSHTKTLSMALAVRPLINNLMQKLGHSWKEESDRLAALESEIRDKPFTGMRSTLPEARQVKQWVKHAHFGMNYHKSTLVDQNENIDCDKHNAKATEQMIESAAEAQTCYTILKALPKTAILSLVAILKNVPISEARDIVDSEKSDIESVILEWLLSDRVECPWGMFYRSELVESEILQIRHQADIIIGQIIKKKITSLRDMANADPNEEAGFNNLQVIARLGDYQRKEALDVNSMVDTTKSLEDETVQDNLNNVIIRLEKVIMSVQSHTYQNMNQELEQF